MISGIFSTPMKWGHVARGLHWLMAIGVIGLQFYGWWMTEVPPRSERLGHYINHANIAYYIILFFVVRIVWRLIDRDNPAHADAAQLRTGTAIPVMARWQQLGAIAGHIGLYALMLGVFVSGWVMHSAFPRRFDVDLFGVWRVPLLFSEGNRSISKLAEGIHEALANLLFALVVVHVVAALWHHFVRRDNVLRRMWR